MNIRGFAGLLDKSLTTKEYNVTVFPLIAGFCHNMSTDVLLMLLIISDVTGPGTK